MTCSMPRLALPIALPIGLLALALSSALATPALASQATPQANTLDVRGADIRAFIQDVARATGTSFIVDPAVQGTVDYSSPQSMSQADMLGVLLTILRSHGLVAVPAGQGTYRVVPDQGAAGQGTGSNAHFATQVIGLRRIDARIAAETLKPLLGRGGVVIATPQGNSLLVADYSDNIARIRSLVAQIDSDNASIDTLTLRNSSAREIAATLNALFGVRGEGGSQVLSILPVESSNSIVIRGDAGVVQRAMNMAAELDRRAESTGDVRVVKLQHASAEQLLPVLQQLIGQGEGSSNTAANGSATASANGSGTVDPNQAVLITPAGGKRPTLARAPGQNALIINADPETQRTLMEVITQLDTRREQVLVEAVVVEISDEASRKLGVQLAAAGRNGDIPLLGTQFPSSQPGIMGLIAGAAAGSDDSAWAQSARSAAANSLLGLSGGLAGIAGQAGDVLFGAIITAVRSDTGSNLLSTPSILTLDNEPARILVGQEVPLTSGEVLGDANSNPFRTIERQDVGIALEVTPQINAGGGITLKLRQEVSSVAGPVSASYNELILNKREIDTRVLVDDGAIVVLGGLLDQQQRQTRDKVPGLGDIPLLGRLFRSDANSDTRTNLMVFLRPTIIRDRADAQRITAPRFDWMRDAQQALPGQPRGGEAALDALVRDYLRSAPPQLPAPADAAAGTPQ